MRYTPTIYIIVAIFTFSYHAHIFAIDSKNKAVFVQYGEPTSTQNVDIESYQLGFRQTLSKPKKQFHLGWSTKFGALKVNGETGYQFALGAFLETEIERFSFSFPIHVIWLEQYEFGQHQLHTKNYGGPLQFSIGAEVAFKLNNQWQLYYQLDHMSNADRYQYNPALNSHNLGIRMRF